MARLREVYKNEIVPALLKQFGYKSTMEVPRVDKIVLNMGVGEAIADKKILDAAVADMQKIAGQKPVITKAKKSIAVWKIRTGYPHRLHGDAAPGPDVRVSRSPGDDRAARGCATFAACRAGRSTAAATSTWASRNN